MFKIAVFVLLTILLGDQGSIMAEEMNPDNNPALIDQVMVAIKLTETEGEKQPYQTLHTPVELYIYGTDAEVQYKIKQFNKDGFVTKTKNGRPVVVAQALGAYGILDINWPVWSKQAGLQGAKWQDPNAQDAVAKYKVQEYFNMFGSWDLVSIAWFAGPETAKEVAKGIEDGLDKKDNMGTSVRDYIIGINNDITEKMMEIKVDVAPDISFTPPVTKPQQTTMNKNLYAAQMLDTLNKAQNPSGQRPDLFASQVPEEAGSFEAAQIKTGIRREEAK